MWIDDVFIVPEHVTHIYPYHQKKHRNGTVTSKGTVIWFTDGRYVIIKSPASQVVSVLGLTKPTPVV